MDINRLVLAFTGIGKTYFCQHHLGWIDLDEEICLYAGGNSCTQFVEIYHKYGYNVLTNASSYMIKRLHQKYPSLIIYMPEDSEEAKNQILERVRTRREDDSYYKYLKNNYDLLYKNTLNAISEEDVVVYIPINKYLQDFLR